MPHAQLNVCRDFEENYFFGCTWYKVEQIYQISMDKKKTEQQKQIQKKSHLVHTHSLQVAATLGISPSIKSVNIETSRNLRWKYMP